MNYSDEINAKMAKMAPEREYLRGQAQTAGFAGETCANAKMENTQERLLCRLRNANNDSERINRALNILNAHPEFEDLIWLIQSGLV